VAKNKTGGLKMYGVCYINKYLREKRKNAGHNRKADKSLESSKRGFESFPSHNR
jgi:hypothetical protein